MPREPSITPEQVAAVADTILAEGGRPTVRALRERLGAGSMGTLHRLLQHWQVGRARPVETSLTLPPAMQRALLDFLVQEITDAKAALAAELAESRQAAADLATENERQGAQTESQATALAGLSAENATQHGRIEQLVAEVARTQTEAAAQIDAAETRARREQQAREAAQVALAKAELRLEALPRLEEVAQRLQAALDAERVARTDAERLAAMAEVQAAGLTERLTDAQAQGRQGLAQTERLVDRSINIVTNHTASRSNFFQRNTTGAAFISSTPFRMRALSSAIEATRIWRRKVRAIFEKAHSIRLSQEPCLGV